MTRQGSTLGQDWSSPAGRRVRNADDPSAVEGPDGYGRVQVLGERRLAPREFFRTLFFKHPTTRVEEEEPADSAIDGLRVERDVVRLGFSDARAFDELVRSAEGVPRDAINIAAKAAFRAKNGKISIPDIRTAARQWYRADKEGALKAVPGGPELLNSIIEQDNRDKKARGFLVNQRGSGAGLITALFDARVLHLVREGYSAQDSPGERYDGYSIDYGAYVDLINTKNYPRGPRCTRRE